MKRAIHKKTLRKRIPSSKPVRDKASLPHFCDYTCPHSDFAPKDAVGDCRKELAVYCTLLKKFNNKNNRCLARTWFQR